VTEWQVAGLQVAGLQVAGLQVADWDLQYRLSLSNFGGLLTLAQ
jgi:hypothetical protein